LISLGFHKDTVHPHPDDVEERFRTRAERRYGAKNKK